MSAVVADVVGAGRAAAPIHIADRLVVTGKNVTSFTHRYWTEADATERVCQTRAGTLRCACGLFALVWAR